MKIYCKKCGGGTEYTSQKPKFCSGCGNGFGIVTPSNASVRAPAREPVAPVPPESRTEYDEVPEETFDTNITKLEFEIEPNRRQGISMGEMMGTSEGKEPRIERQPSVPKRQSKKKFLEEFQKEAGQIRPS